MLYYFDHAHTNTNKLFLGGTHMNYEDFKKNLMHDLEGMALQEKFKPSLSKIEKDNQVVDVITFLPIDHPDAPTVSPVFYPFFLYETGYLQGETIEDIAKKMVDTIATKKATPDFLTEFAKNFKNYAFVRDNLRIKVISRERNKTLLENVPHEDLLDLAIVPICDVIMHDGTTGTITITYEILEDWNVTAEQLLCDAKKSMRTNHPVKLQDMAGALRSFGFNGFIPEGPNEDMLLVLSTEAYTYGAAYIAYDDVLRNIRDGIIGGNYFIFPSSVHEILLAPDEPLKELEVNVEYLYSMVKEINNSDCVKEDEFLSNNVYYYGENGLEVCKLGHDGTADALTA